MVPVTLFEIDNLWVTASKLVERTLVLVVILRCMRPSSSGRSIVRIYRDLTFDEAYIS